MSAHISAPSARRWLQRLFGAQSDQPYGLSDDWAVIEGPGRRTEVAIGPGGVFLLDHRHTRPRDVARHAGDLSGHLTAALGHCVSVHGVLVEEAERAVRADQPHGVTIVTSIVLGPWLESHPRAFDEREVHKLARALRQEASPSRTG